MAELEENEEEGGGGDWMTTYADLMSLLMCFFVLLLSFSEMDVNKYKQLSGSMKQAFGVQHEIKLKHVPKGTSVIAREFSPGRPNPTVVKTIQQISTNSLQNSLDVRTESPGDEDGRGRPISEQDRVKKLYEKNEEVALRLMEKLRYQIDAGDIEVDYDHNAISVKIREQGSFPSGSANLNREFLPTIPALQQALKETPGAISVEGHTDNVPISTPRYRSNWELSSQRALSFAHALMEDPEISPQRFMIVGYADSRPRMPNDSWSNRAQNRRVEILIKRGEEQAEFGLNTLNQKD